MTLIPQSLALIKSQGFIYFVCVGLPLSMVVAAEPIVVQPEESLAKAIVLARSAPKPVVIELAAGRHETGGVIHLKPEDSGLVIRGPSTGVATVVGSRRIDGWKLVDASRSIWEAPLPVPVDEHASAHVFWNGKRLQVARTPNEGWMETTEKLAQGAPFAMTIPKDVLKPNWAELGDVYVVCLQKWAGFKQPIREINAEENRATLVTGPPPHRLETKNRFWIENAPDALDAPGEWYLNRQAGVLRVIPPRDGQGADVSDITISTLPMLMRLEGCENVTIQNLIFTECSDDFPVKNGEIDSQAAASRRGSVQLDGCRNCVVDHCIVQEVAGYAIDIGYGSRNCSVSHCQLRNLGAGGVRIGGQSPDPAPERQVSGHTVADCQIHNYGQVYRGGVGAIIFQAFENRLIHNEIHHAPFSGISVGWTWGYSDSPCRGNLVEANHIHHLGGKILSDLGGIYHLGPQPDTVVRNNWVHDIRCFDYGAHGLYTDEGSTGILFEKNIVIGCQSAGFHQHFGRDNTVRGNLFVYCGEGTVRRTREEDQLSFTFIGNIVVGDKPGFLNYTFKNGFFKFDQNIYFARQMKNAKWFGMDWKTWQAKGQDENSLIADPRFRDLAHPEQGFKPKSPINQINFEMPDIREIGVRAK